MDKVNKQNLLDASYSNFKEVFNKYPQWLKDHNMSKYLPDKEIVWKEDTGSINTIVVRCNSMMIGNDEIRNNDYLIVCENKKDTSTGEEYVTTYVFNATADPKTEKRGIANVMPQMYFGNIRNHHYTSGRPAICQDLCEVWVRRWVSKSVYNDYKGFFTIHIHNPAGFFNSSLGCVIISGDKDYVDYYRPILQRVESAGFASNIPVAVFQQEVFLELFNTTI